MKRMLADVLWDAANERLSPTFNDSYPKTDRYSCYAVSLALTGSLGSPGLSSLHHNPPSLRLAYEFLYALGLDYHADDTLWAEFSAGALQGVRYMWLLLAMHVAEDEGIEL